MPPSLEGGGGGGGGGGGVMIIHWILENNMSRVGLYLHECCRQECKYRAKQMSDIIQYPVFIMYKAHAAMGLYKHQGGDNNPMHNPFARGNTLIPPHHSFSMGMRFY